MTARLFSIRACDGDARALCEQILSGGPILSGDIGDEQSRRGDWELVKQNALRSIYKVATTDGAVFVKEHTVRGLGHRIKSQAFGNPAQREYEASQYAAAHDIPCVRIFAVASSRTDKPARAISLSHAIEDAAPLSTEYVRVAQEGSRSAQTAIAASVARLLAKAHVAGFLHADEHPGNIMVQRVADEQFECAYVDLYGARCSQDVTMLDAAHSLAALGQWFRDRTSRTMRVAFVKHYIQLRGWPSTRKFLKDFLACIDTASKRHSQLLYHKRDRRIGKTNAHFKRIELAGGWLAWITTRFRRQQELTGTKPPTWPDDNLANHLQKTFGVDTSRDGEGSITNGPYDSTRFALTRCEGLSWNLFGSPARRRYVTACAAMNRDIPTVLPIGYAKKRAGIIVTCTKQITGRPSQCVPLEVLARQIPNESKRRLLERVGRLLALTFDRGLAIRNISPARLEVACHEGVDIPLWAGIVGIATRRELSKAVQTWMLARFASEAMLAGHVDAVQMARVLRACVLRCDPTARWKDVWREAKNTVDLTCGSEVSPIPTRETQSEDNPAHDR